MKTLLSSTSALLLACTGALHAAEPPAAADAGEYRYNVPLILTDDLSWSDTTLVKTPAVLEIMLDAPGAGPGRVEWRMAGEEEFGKDSAVAFRVCVDVDRVSIPLPVPAGQTIEQLRITLPHQHGPIRLSEIHPRGEDGTEALDRFNAGVQ
jgi:hypothetical protein